MCCAGRPARAPGWVSRYPSSFSNRSASSNGPDQREPQPLVRDQVLRDALHVLGRDRVEPVEHLVGIGRVPLEHLAAQAEEDQPLRALELEDEAALGEVARLLELVRPDRLGGDRAQLAERSSSRPRRCG